MVKRMLVDATHPEETRVAIVDGTWLSDFDYERASKKQLKGNIYLAKVIRIEPSLQAAFVEYGGNRHGFLPFTEIHPDYYRIPMADRPAEEVAGDEDQEGAGDEAAEQGEAEIGATPEERELAEEAAAEASAEQGLDDHVETSIAEAAPLTGEQPPMPEFAAAPEGDLGLITDFGNAAVIDPSIAPPEQIPLETVGGEVAEQAIERFHRPRHRYKIQEVVKRRQVMLVQVVKEERGNKGAALTTFLSLAGRYCVLMPNTERGGGVSRKITSHQDRRRMKEILDQLEIPEGMAVILRTAGMEQEPAEIQRDLEYLLRLWNNIREQTLQSTAPALIYEEANLMKRSMRDLYAHDVEEILVSGKDGYQLAHDFMHTIMPDQVSKIKLYEDPIPLFFRYRVESQIDQLYSPTIQLRSGGYIVINPTEALVAIDVNSGRATRERHIEGTALKTNLEAAEEIARQLRLRDLAGLIVIDFIDMEDGRNNAAVERRLKEAMRSDRARLQIGRISPFGLLELSRQRLRPSLMEINFEKCPHCAGAGYVRSVDSAALSILRTIEEEGIKQGGAEIMLHVPTPIALYILNQKRPALSEIEKRYGLQVVLHSDDTLVQPEYKIERVRANNERAQGPAVNLDQILAGTEPPAPPVIVESPEAPAPENAANDDQNNQRFGRRRNRFGHGRNRNRHQRQYADQQPPAPEGHNEQEVNGNLAETPAEVDDNLGNAVAPSYSEGQQDQQQRRRRRGRRGGRGRRGNGRPPRDNNFQQQQPYEPRERDWNRNYERNAPPAHEIPVAVPSIPASIHEIDTTPREAPRPESHPSSPSVSSPYEIVDHPTDKPKGGWWKRLTGQ